MLSQMRRIAAPSATLMMPATGAVCPRKKAAVAEASISGSDAQAVVPTHPGFEVRLATLAANAIMLTLTSICSGRNFGCGFGQHCTSQVPAGAAALQRRHDGIRRQCGEPDLE